GDIVIKADGFGASVFVSTKLTDTLEPQLLWIQSFKDAGGLIRPRLNWNAAKNTTAGFGVDIFTGPSDGYFGRYNNRDRVYAELRYDFGAGRRDRPAARAWGTRPEHAMIDAPWLKALVKVLVLPPTGLLLLAAVGLALCGRYPRVGRAIAAGCVAA